MGEIPIRSRKILIKYVYEANPVFSAIAVTFKAVVLKKLFAMCKRYSSKYSCKVLWVCAFINRLI